MGQRERAIRLDSHVGSIYTGPTVTKADYEAIEMRGILRVPRLSDCILEWIGEIHERWKVMVGGKRVADTTG